MESEFIPIMGRSECGKTTLLNILGCMDSFDDGDYFLDRAILLVEKPSSLQAVFPHVIRSKDITGAEGHFSCKVCYL